MTATLHVVGAGVSGLTAALLASRQGWRTVVHEASPQAGGRCRTLVRNGLTYDNGTHVVLSANRATLALLRSIDALDGWIEPEPHGLPVVDLVSRSAARIGLSPWTWASAACRPPGTSLADLVRLMPLLTAARGRTVASFGGSAGTAQLLELLSVAVLNTAPAHASAHMLGRVVGRLLAPGAGRLLVARTGLGPDLIRPLERASIRSGAVIRFGRRLLEVVRAGDRAGSMVFDDEVVELAPGDRVVLALPPAALRAVLPDIAAPGSFEPIVNLHWPHDAAGPIRFVGLTGGLAQWVLVRPGMLSVTISAAAQIVDRSADELAREVWPEICEATGRLGIPIDGAVPARFRVVKERMATPRQDCAYAQAGPPPRRPFPNLALAGDWTSGLPATIEGAVVAASTALRAIGARRAARLGHPVERELAA